MAFALLAPKPSSHPFHDRQLSLKEPVKIGRAVAKAKSSNNNGIFDCKVLSRNHAVMWYENGKVRRITFAGCHLLFFMRLPFK